jgi:hypothetical protein
LPTKKKNRLAGSLCFASLLSDPVDEALLRQSAELGYSLAQARMAGTEGGEARFRLAKSATSQRDRDGFYHLGRCYKFSTGCEMDWKKAKECYVIAAQLGSVASMKFLGALLDLSDPQRWFWRGRLAVIGLPDGLLNNVASAVQEFKSGSGNGAVVFQIGKALNGQIIVEKRTTIFGAEDWNDFDDRIGPANSAISFYKVQLAACRRAVDTWTQVGMKWKVVKDIRILIGKMIWETRDLALFVVQEPSLRSKQTKRAQKKAQK